MKIKFVNHASFIIESGTTKLICDPWMEGHAFDNGWRLLSDTRLNYDDFKNITHIWFSHEHPDHFSPPNLLKIPKEYRDLITILFQETVDQKVVDFCKKIGFREQIGLKENERYFIEEKFSIICNPYTDGDSFAVFEDSSTKLLNLNDCIVNSNQRAKEIFETVGKVDVLFTQFGYANKVGNTDETDKREQASREKLDRIRYQVNHLQPKYVVPFASFIYFCHEENRYMNEGMNHIQEVYDFVEENTSSDCTVLYPDDEWDASSKIDSNKAIESYNSDYSKIKSATFEKADVIPIEELIRNSENFMEKILHGFPSNEDFIKGLDCRIYLDDYKRFYELKGGVGLRESRINEESCDLAVSSEALNYTFLHLWGGDTLNVNARFQTTESGNYYKFRYLAVIASCLNRGEEFPTPSPRLYQ
jgi:UDP-MurNAc hydroxylase